MASGEFCPMILHGDGPHGQASPALLNLIVQMLRYYDGPRPSAAELRSHEWFNSRYVHFFNSCHLLFSVGHTHIENTSCLYETRETEICL